MLWRSLQLPPQHPHKILIELIKVDCNAKCVDRDVGTVKSRLSESGHEFELVTRHEAAQQLPWNADCRPVCCTCTSTCSSPNGCHAWRRCCFNSKHQLISHFNNRITVCIACDLSFPTFCKQITPISVATMATTPIMPIGNNNSNNNNTNDYSFAFR